MVSSLDAEHRTAPQREPRRERLVHSCAIGGLVFIWIGARAGGLALLGAVAGAIIGFGLVSSDFDLLPKGAMVGATIGTFLGGLLGLAWRPSASAVVLRSLGSVTALVGAPDRARRVGRVTPTLSASVA
jgi:hypothetical protein